MKNLIKRNLSVVVMTLALVLSSSAFAQRQGGGQQRGRAIPNAEQITKMVTSLSEALTLNKDQETTITKLYTAHFEEVKEASTDGRPDREKMQALQTEFEKKVKAQLTEKQQKLFDEYQAKNKPGKRQGNRPARQ